MAELFRHDDEDGYAISVYTPRGRDGLVVDVWPTHAIHRLGCVELPDDAAKLLLDALLKHFGQRDGSASDE